MRHIYTCALLAAFSLVLCACGEQITEPTESTSEQRDTSEPETTRDELKASGEAVAKEILAAYDQAVADALELVKDKPAAAEVKIKLQELIDGYKEKMETLAEKKLALTDIEAWGAANGYMGENRGKHVFDNNAKLDEFLAHYMYNDKDDEVVELLKNKIIQLIDLADASR